MAKKQVNLNARIFFLYMVMTLLFLVLIVRFGILQIFQHQEMTERAMAAAQDNVVRQSPRGKILDRNGRES